MTDRQDVNRLTQAQRELVRLARDDLTNLFGSFPSGRPEFARDALLEVVPFLVREYGNLASIAAAEWYEGVRPGQFLARTVDGFPQVGVEQGVRYHAGALFDGDPDSALSGLQGALQRYVTYSGRVTVARNVQLDPLKPRFARVPTGAETCAWCAMLASRGFVYVSKATAGIIADDYHDDCDCQIVAQFDGPDAHIEGYDPDVLYDMYSQARELSRGTTDREIAAAMRELFPDQFTDGHTH